VRAIGRDLQPHGYLAYKKQGYLAHKKLRPPGCKWAVGGRVAFERGGEKKREGETEGRSERKEERECVCERERGIGGEGEREGEKERAMWPRGLIRSNASRRARPAREGASVGKRAG